MSAYSNEEYRDAKAAYREAYELANAKPCPFLSRHGQFIHIGGGVSVRLKRLRELTQNLLDRATPPSPTPAPPSEAPPR